ncbi:MAG: ATP-binding protein, partial [Oscillospiraceae bacterium]|nr:ATP-binding protein [Oscillospiraceae bacterium]
QQLEDGVVTISRAAGTTKYPSRFMLVCAMNPCKCGWYGHPSGRCTCSPDSVQKYRAKVSGPLLDRIDIHIEVPALEFDELRDKTPSASSKEIKERVDRAREVQRKRYSGSGIASNSQISSAVLREYCELDGKCEALLKSAFDRLGLTARSYDRILRVARTIADLDGAENIAQKHIAEAIQYRSYEFEKK